MTTPFTCVLIAFLLIFAPKIAMTIAAARLPEGYDNKHPRAQQAKLKGWGARATAAHQNAFETFPAFATAVLIAHISGANDHRAAVLSIGFVVSRTIYTAAYIANLDYLRSAVWMLGVMCIIALFCLPWLGTS